MCCKLLQNMLRTIFFVITHLQRYFASIYLHSFAQQGPLSLQILLKPEKMTAIVHQFLPNGQVLFYVTVMSIHRPYALLNDCLNLYPVFTGFGKIILPLSHDNQYQSKFSN